MSHPSAPTPSLAPVPTAAAPSPSDAAAREAPPPSKAPSTLRDVDWRNRGYLPGVIDLHDGRSELHEYNVGGLHDTDLFKLAEVLYGDLNADGVEDALVVINGEHYAARAYASPRRSGRAFLFTLREGSVRSLSSVTECCSPIRRATIVGGALEFDREEGGPTCTVRYRWEGASLREDKAAKRCTALPGRSRP